MDLSRVHRHQETTHRITRHAWVDAWKAAMDSEAGLLNTPAGGSSDDKDHLL
jgi:hypothetical protein